MRTFLNAESSLAREFWEHGRSASCPVIDMHGHMGAFSGIRFAAETPERAVRHMDRAGVRLLCFAHHDALSSPDVGNRTALEAVRAFPDRLRAYLTLNPNYPDLMKREMALLDREPGVFTGFKFHSGMHQVPMDDPRYERPLAIAQERRLPVLFHTWGGQGLCGATQTRNVAKRFPGVPMILGHALHGTWHEACAVAREFPNTYLELTAVVGRRGVVELLVAEAGSDRILYGTDMPWFDEHHYIGNILAAGVSDDDRHNILHRNAERILAGIR